MRVGVRFPTTLAISVALFALNALICWPLFWVEYLNDFQSNEGSYITFGRFFLESWPHVSWFPWFNAGMAFEDTYLPLVTIAISIVSFVGSCSPAHAFHFIAAFTYSLAPVSLFLFARALSGRAFPSAFGAVLWSLMSLSVLFPQIRVDMGTSFGIRRLQNIVWYGETPHNVALCLLPICLLLLNAFLNRPSAGRFGIASLAISAVMLSNAFGISAIAISSSLLIATRREHGWRELTYTAGVLLTSYLAICRALPPSLIRLIGRNSQLVGGDYRFTSRSVAAVSLLAAVLALVWLFSVRIDDQLFRFACLFSTCFGGITFLGFMHWAIVPQPERYHLEMEAGLCLIVAMLVASAFSRLHVNIAMLATMCCAGLLVFMIREDFDYSRRLIRPADIATSLPYREARWIEQHLAGQRILVATEGQWLFNLFASNPQLGGGHEPSAPNWVQRVAIYTIYSGQNAGERDGPISILWLKAFGCGGIVVPSSRSPDHYHAVVNPGKFDGRLPLVWREGGDSIFQIPLRSTSLAHVIPRAAVVTRQPTSGLDLDGVRVYVEALENAAMPVAELIWRNPDHGTIRTSMDASEVVSVQMTYDPGWQARVGDTTVPTRADQLGLITIEPRCSGECSIDLDYSGGTERKICLAISLIVVSALLIASLWRVIGR